MAQHNNLGRQGETLAAQYLVDHGYSILDTNYRYGKLEVDIIAYGETDIVFVEVKTRSTDTFGEPETFVDKKKQRAYVKAANHYILTKQRRESVRFDIIGIVTTADGTQINHIKNAFNVIEALSK